ncbi:MAG: hypothetical protein IPK11_02245 [Ignavibacteria bacterium]|nr:hypothetical protein [Ignavibacteria bacterium]
MNVTGVGNGVSVSNGPSTFAAATGAANVVSIDGSATNGGLNLVGADTDLRMNGNPGTANASFLVSNGANVTPSWSNTLPTGATAAFNQITAGTNTGQALTVGLGSVLAPAAVAIGEIRANELFDGATFEGNYTWTGTNTVTGAVNHNGNTSTYNAASTINSAGIVGLTGVTTINNAASTFTGQTVTVTNGAGNAITSTANNNDAVNANTQAGTAVRAAATTTGQAINASSATGVTIAATAGDASTITADNNSATNATVAINNAGAGASLAVTGNRTATNSVATITNNTPNGGRALTVQSSTVGAVAANTEATLVVNNTLAPAVNAYAIRTNGHIQINSWIEAGNAAAARHQNVIMGHDLALAGHPGFDFGSGDGLVIGPKTGAGAGKSFQVDASSGDVRVGVYTTGAPTDRYTEMDGATGDITMQGSNMIINFNDDAATNTYALAVTHNGSTAASTGGAAQFSIPTGASGANGPVVRIERGQPSANVTAALELAVTSVTDQNSALTISHAGQGAASALNIQFDNVNNQSRAIVVDNGHTVLSFQD